MSLVSRIKDILTAKLHFNKHKNTNNEVIQQEILSPIEECKQIFLNVWKRPVSKVITQLGKDLPRFADNIHFYSVINTEQLKDIFKDDNNEYLVVPKDDHCLDDFLLSNDDIKLLEHTKKRLYYLKTTLLAFCLKTELEQEESKSFQFIINEFDDILGDSLDLSSECAYFIEKAFLQEGLNETEFPVESATLNLLRCITQGHYSSYATGFQSRLDLANITSHLKHEIYITLSDDTDDSNYKIYHFKAETANWGTIFWYFVCDITKDGKTILSYEFTIYSVELIDGIDEDKKTIIMNALEPFLDTKE